MWKKIEKLLFSNRKRKIITSICLVVLIIGIIVIIFRYSGETKEEVDLSTIIGLSQNGYIEKLEHSGEYLLVGIKDKETSNYKVNNIGGELFKVSDVDKITAYVGGLTLTDLKELGLVTPGMVSFYFGC